MLGRGQPHMANFIYSAAMSVDGFIAGPGGGMSWMADYAGPNPVGCLRAGVLDEVMLSVPPVLLGDVVRVFEHPGGEAVRLEQRDATHHQITSFWHRVNRCRSRGAVRLLKPVTY